MRSVCVWGGGGAVGGRIEVLEVVKYCMLLWGEDEEFI